MGFHVGGAGVVVVVVVDVGWRQMHGCPCVHGSCCWLNGCELNSRLGSAHEQPDGGAP
jgi:hypothetical protein